MVFIDLVIQVIYFIQNHPILNFPSYILINDKPKFLIDDIDFYQENQTLELNFLILRKY